VSRCIEPGEQVIAVKGHSHLVWWDGRGFYGIFDGEVESAPPLHEAQTRKRHPLAAARAYLQRMWREYEARRALAAREGEERAK
jgi:hypothetical protein